MQANTHSKFIIFFILLLLCSSGLYANTQGIAETIYSGTQNITCEQLGINNYRLRNTIFGNSAIIHTGIAANMSKAGSVGWDVTDIPTNLTTNWNLTWSAFDDYQHALDVHWGVEKTLEYFKNVHNRIGIAPDVPVIK